MIGAKARARRFAERLANAVDSDTDARISLAFLIAIGRMPLETELDSAHRFIRAQTDTYADKPDGPQRAWIDLCQMLMASNAFLYVE